MAEKVQVRKRPAAAANAADMSTGLQLVVAEAPPSDKRRRNSLKFSRQLLECTICCMDVESGDAVRLGCSHGWYCRGCLERYAQARLNEGAVDVSCPDCREPVPDCDLKKILPQDVILRFHARSISRAVAASSNLFTCPTPNCGMCFELDEGDDAHLRQCLKCWKGSCLRCGAQPYHVGLSCTEHAAKMARIKQKPQASDASLWRWMRRTGTVQCPVCKMGVSKEDLASQQTQRKECHKMFCRGCMTKFCFKCLAIFTDDYSCRCSIQAHGFVNPLNGRRVEHAKVKVARRRGAAGA